MYNFLRSTAAHSTVLIDGHGQSRASKAGARRRSEPDGPHVKMAGNIVILSGRYGDGYGGGAAGIIHERTIECDMESATWTLHDTVWGEGEHLVEARFQFAPSSWEESERTVTVRCNSVVMRLQADARWRELAVMEGSMNPKGGWFSSGLNRLAPAPCVRLFGSYMLPFKVTTTLTARKFMEGSPDL
jgi:hypothetical protein